MAMVITMKCAYCQRELRAPFYEENEPYCNKRCFYEHMENLSDIHALQEFIEDGPNDIHPNKLKGMIRGNLILRNRKTKMYSLTDKSRKILEMNMLVVS